MPLLPNRRLLLACGVATSVLGLGACGDDPFQVRWAADVDTVTLFSLARPDLGLGSAFNFDQRRILVVESPGSTGQWDFAVDDDGTEMFLVPPPALGITSRAGIAPLAGLSFDEVLEAPRDSAAYVVDERVPVEIGTVYAIRTSEARGFFGEVCVYYAKMVPIVADLDAQTLDFFFDASPVCNDRSLVPTDTDPDPS